MEKMSDSDVQSLLAQLPGWTLEQGKLHREYHFADFNQAFRFMTTAAAPIDKMNHHPEWLNVYNRVIVNLTTHDAGGITMQDFDLAMMLEGIAQKFS